jgi:hypothetical protein
MASRPSRPVDKQAAQLALRCSDRRGLWRDLHCFRVTVLCTGMFRVECAATCHFENYLIAFFERYLIAPIAGTLHRHCESGVS